MTKCPRWTQEQDKFVEENYLTMQYSEIADCIGKTAAAVRNRCYEHQWHKAVDEWTTSEVHTLMTWYISHLDGTGDFRLDDLAKTLGRLKSNVCRKARELGLTDLKRKSGDGVKERISIRVKKQWQNQEHPRGMLGKHHTPEVCAIVSKAHKDRYANMTKKAKTEIALKAVNTRIKKYGSGRVSTSSNAYSRCKRGYRDDIGDFFFRSAWEANYARYLNFLIKNKKIQKWEYEVDTFLFPEVVRGQRSYLPDFKVWDNEGNVCYHEVKGWMNAASKSKLKKMKKYYPDVALIVIASKEYYAIEKFKAMIPNWEDPEGKK